MRRSFINQVASLLIPGYANRLQSFTHVAKQRAALLKQLGQWQRAGSPIDAALSGLEIWTGQFIEAGVALSRDRQRIIAELNKSFGPLYARLAGVAGDLPSMRKFRMPRRMVVSRQRSNTCRHSTRSLEHRRPNR